MMRLDVLTLFPEIFSGYLGQSLLKQAIDRSLVDVQLHNIRDWSRDKHKKVDDRPYGGGPGMVLRPEPVVESVESVKKLVDNPGHLVMLTPGGRPLRQEVVVELAGHDRLLLLCGRYEGFDGRVSELLEPDEISIGDYVLGGGEVAAMVIIDAVIRLVPDVLGDENSSRWDSFSSEQFPHRQRILEHLQYTRPREFRGLRVPDVLLKGDHQAVAKWREEESYKRTRTRRADLLKGPARQLGPNSGAQPNSGALGGQPPEIDPT